MSTTEQTATDKKALQKRLIFAWVDALRSGEFSQGQQYLERDGCLCCLGVACRVIERVEPDRVKTSVSNFDASTVMFSVDGEDCVRWLSPKAARLMGLRESGGEYEGGTLMAHNDTGASFQEIADIIEANADTLFVNGDEVHAWFQERKQHTAG